MGPGRPLWSLQRNTSIANSLPSQLICGMASSSAPTRTPGPYRGDALVAEETVGYLVKLFYISMQRVVDREMAPLDLTAMQWRPILLLHKGLADTPVELARLLDIDTGAMTRSLDRLEGKGLLRRVRNHEDRRMIRIELTDEGRARAMQVPDALAEAQNIHVRGLSAEELATFKHLIRRMIANGAPP